MSATSVYLANQAYPIKLFKKFNVPFEEMPGMWYEALHFVEVEWPLKCQCAKYHKILAYRKLCNTIRDNAGAVGNQLPEDWARLDRTKSKKWSNLQSQYTYEANLDYDSNVEDDEIDAGI